MDVHSILLKKAKQLSAVLRAKGADKPGENEKLSIFTKKGDMIYLVGNVFSTDAENNSSVQVDLDSDYKVQKTMLSAMRHDLVSGFQEVSEDGIFGALLRAALPSGFGFDITTSSDISEEDFLFKDPGTCAVVAVPVDKDEEFVHYLFDHEVALLTLGHVTKGDIRVDDEPFGKVDTL